MSDNQKKIYVYGDWEGGGPFLVGKLYAGISRGEQFRLSRSAIEYMRPAFDMAYK